MQLSTLMEPSGASIFRFATTPSDLNKTVVSLESLRECVLHDMKLINQIHRYNHCS